MVDREFATRLADQLAGLGSERGLFSTGSSSSISLVDYILRIDAGNPRTDGNFYLFIYCFILIERLFTALSKQHYYTMEGLVDSSPEDKVHIYCNADSIPADCADDLDFDVDVCLSPPLPPLLLSMDEPLGMLGLSLYRALITAFVIVSKFHSDWFYPNSYYASLGGITAGELDMCEIAFLKAIDWRLIICTEEVKRAVAALAL